MTTRPAIPVISPPLTNRASVGLQFLLAGAELGETTQEVFDAAESEQPQRVVLDSYLADKVVMLRYFEAHAQVRRAISVVKKRAGMHETTIREFQINRSGLIVAEPLHDFHGILRCVPLYLGDDTIRDLDLRDGARGVAAGASTERRA